MLQFALPHGSSKSAMMAHSSTGEIKNNASNGNKKSNGTVENGIRAGRNGKRSNTAMSISHGTVAALSFLLLLVVTIFNFAGGAGVTVDANAGVNKEIRGFHRRWKRHGKHERTAAGANDAESDGAFNFQRSS